MTDWDGEERRKPQADYSFVREIIRDELMTIKYQQDKLLREHSEIAQKIQNWEAGAKWFRVFIIGTVGIVTATAAAWEWMREHVK